MQLSAQLDERISKCEEILSQNSGSLVFAALSDAYRKRGDQSKAFHICAQGLKLHPDYGPGHLVMARINLERGMYTEAEKELTLAEQADGRTRATELLLAQILIKKDQLEDAKRVLEHIKAADPENQAVVELLESIRQDAEVGRTGLDLMTVQERFRIAKVIDLKDGVHYLKSLPAVLGASLVGEDGLVMASKLNPNLNEELVGAVAAKIIGCVSQGVSNIGFGEYQNVWIDTADLSFWITAFGKQALVLCCAPDANVGALRLRVKELLDHLSANLQAKGAR